MEIGNELASLARQYDEEDSLKSYRHRFHIPMKGDDQVIYFCGNSLGLQPKSAATFIAHEVDRWKNLGVEGHFQGELPWVDFHKYSKDALGRLVGAKPEEVVAMNNLTTNLHLMLASFYRPTDQRKKLIIESGAFPSDHFAVSTFMELKGVDPAEHLIELEADATGYLSLPQTLEVIEEVGSELALVLLPGIQYYSGQWLAVGPITAAAHAQGAFVGFDLAHAIGNVPLQLHDDGVDFAVWCTYKYLNSGPGSVSGVYIHERHAQDVTFPRLGGWWAQQEEERFQMENVFKPMQGADGWQLSNMNILGSAAHHASLEIFEAAGMDRLRAKSLKLTAYLETLLQDNVTIRPNIKILTPSNPEERGCQLSLFLPNHGKEIFDELINRGVVLDWREPNVIRVAPTPLYNTFEEVATFVHILEGAFTRHQ
ncbi:MAG: kynureninase [Bacteroidota bacterium]